MNEYIRINYTLIVANSEDLEKSHFPHRKCPYCGKYQALNYENIKPYDDITFVSKLEDQIITDSFFEVTTKSECINCGKVFHFIHDLHESINSRSGTKYEYLDKNEQQQ